MPNSPPEKDPYPAWTRAEAARKFRLFMALVDCLVSVLLLWLVVGTMCTDDYDASGCDSSNGRLLIPVVMTGAGLIAHRLAERSLDESETRALRVTATVLLGIPFSIVVAAFILIFFLLPIWLSD